MTKKTYLFGTKLRMFLSELPLGFLLVISIINNDRSEGLLKLWPMIITVCGFMLFIFLYFFRAVSISYEEIRAVGLFSSKEARSVEKDRTVVLTLRKNHRLRVELFGRDERPEFDWIKKDEISDEDVNLFSEKAVGGKSDVKRVLKFFGVPKDELDSVFETENFEGKYELVSVSSETVNEEKKIKIKILETV